MPRGVAAAVRAALRRAAMRTTSVSIPFGGSAAYVRLLYRIWSRFYDASVGVDPAFGANARRMVEAAVRPGDRVLDVGMGTGLLAEPAAARARSYVGIDSSGAMLARAARKVAARRLGNVSMRWGDARSLPFADGSFDAVLSSFALPHFPGDEKAGVLGEMCRVLAPGGRLGLFLARGEVAPIFATLPELERLLAAAGFSDVAIDDRDDVYRIVVARGAAPKAA